MTIQYLKDNNLIIFEAIVGSQAYGTSTPESDTDIKGVFMIPLKNLMDFNYVSQISDETNDTTYFELGRFLQLIQTNNPTVLELLNIPENCILHKDPIFDMILSQKEKFITKLCKFSFGGYAIDQIKKARGLNKKIVKQFDEHRKDVLDFCYVPKGQGSVPVRMFLSSLGYSQSDCGLVAIPHMRYTYNVFCNPSGNYKGIVKNEEKSNDVCVSSVAKNAVPDFIMQFNKDGYSIYCKQYKEYWDWVKKRNKQRFLDNMLHSGGYDGKNLAHCHRLLDTAIEIGQGLGINVLRPNREFLLSIRKGEHDYETLVSEAESKILLMDTIYKDSSLPESVDVEHINNLLIDMRKERYFDTESIMKMSFFHIDRQLV